MNAGSPDSPSPFGPQLIHRDSRALFGHAGRAVLGQVAALVAGLACTVVTIRLLGRTADYGRFALFFMLLEIVSKIVGWPNLGLVRLGREELAHTRRIADAFWARGSLYLLCAAGAAALVFGLRIPLDRYLHLDEYPVHILLILYIVLNEFILLSRSVFQTVSNFRAYAVATASVKFLNLGMLLIVFIILARGAAPDRVLVTHIASLTIVAFVCLAMMPWKSVSPVRVRASTVGRMSAYSWPLFLAGLSALVVNWIDMVVIRYFWSDAEVGLYAAAYQLVIVLIALGTALIGVVMPLLVSLAVEKRHDAMTRYLDDALPQIAWALGLGGIVLCVGSEFIPVIFGSGYQPSVVPCQVLIAGVAFFIFSGFQAAMVKAVDRVRATLWVGLVLAALNILFDIALVPEFGIHGAAIGTTAAFVLSGLFYFPILNSMAPLRGPHPFRRYAALPGLAALLVMAAAALAFDRVPVRIGVGAGVFVAWAVLAKAVGIFRRAALTDLDRMQMPAFVRRAVHGFYALLGR